MTGPNLRGINPAKTIPALVIGGIGIVRNLGEEGIPVYTGSDILENHILYSRYSKKRVFFSDLDGKKFVEELIAFAKGEGRKLMFFSDDDRAILTFSQYQEELSPYYYFTFPSAEMVDSILDKRKFAALSRKLDLPIPWSLAPKSMEELGKAMPEITYPCIIKPAHKEDWWSPKFAEVLGAYRKAIECHSREELMEYYPKVLQVGPNVLLQELVEGDDSQLYSINMYYDRNGKLKGQYVAHKHRTYPIHAGQGCCVETVKDDKILESSIETGRKLGMVGLCNMQYKIDKRGNLKIMELHVRNSVWSYLGKASGMNLYYYAYLDQQGAPWPYPDDYETGVKFIDLKRDIKALLAYRKTGEWTLMRGIKSWRGKIVFHIFNGRDPLPFFMDAWFELLRRVLKKPTTPGRVSNTTMTTGR
jgi:D-aspartate ligase